MSIDHRRDLPIDPERLDYFTDLLHRNYSKYFHLPLEDRPPILMAALLAEQVEWQKQMTFFLQEAYDIYNSRFR